MAKLRILSLLFILISICQSASAIGEVEDDGDLKAKKDTFNYVPQINGTIRAKFEYEPQIESYRFQVRNARVSLKGLVTPLVDYKAEIDLCDRGEIRVLDVYGRVTLKNDIVAFTLGQMRVPFSVDATRSPHLLYFANRSFIAKQVGNVRDVGFKVAFASKRIPLNVEFGVFNGSGLTAQKKWHKECSFSGKINYKYNGFKFEVGGQSIIPDSIRINLLNASISWSYRRWFIESEYIHKYYTKNSFKAVNAYNIMANYKIPLNRFFESIILGTRFDGMTDHSSGTRNNLGQLEIDDVARKRLTLGGTLSFKKTFQTDIRLNYEKYFYNDDAIIAESDRDKLVVELMIHF